MNASALLRSQIEARIPSAFVVSKPQSREFIPTGVAAIDNLTGGVPVNAMTEICGSRVASSGKTSVLMSLLAKATMQERFCALVDGCDGFDPASGEAAGINLSRLLWCGVERPSKSSSRWSRHSKLRTSSFRVPASDWLPLISAIFPRNVFAMFHSHRGFGSAGSQRNCRWLSCLSSRSHMQQAVQG